MQGDNKCLWTRKSTTKMSRKTPAAQYSRMEYAGDERVEFEAAPGGVPEGGPSAKAVFEILARENSGMLTAFLRSMVTRQEIVDDLFQEAMMVAWRRLGEYDRSRPFGAWLRGIAAKLVLAHRRQSASGMVSCQPEVLDALDRRMGDFEKLPGDSFQERLNRLAQCLERLPGPMREAIEMGYGRDMLLGAVARALDVTEETVKKRVQRARQALADCVGTPGGLA